ncbi:carboxypeptidase-like regulatory domain-containing protein [Mucilaginibacter myungsuensis]|uniref:Carboxypeptidase-like regulatory domain-containing protein n=1 Tax=Mucilaginibacter myungsuensis TaxID=649104 RepID=A0A929L1W5_9SPHI|nr:carboxypeptidase-like regulatory domain-containing protein [Mucilaginibacter myungsuensis]MBE9664618.1 carboxypeptidase-like regulatory domain-containing protein [Mucilaginibacter myungsuensis]MDN3601492.1 carboxypeptidase-like regulatory domain-containing protein [Mucilaginibacter myungsuensis]
MAVLAHAQNVSGKVTDAATGKPIEGASVYLPGTYTGTTTDSLGLFSFTTTKTNVPLTISSVGYQSKVINRFVDTVLNIGLTRKTELLDEIKVVVDEMSRAKKLRMFIEEFIGESGSNCVITNPDVIWLRYDKNKQELTAGAERPIIIKNKKLGYVVNYYLSDFKFIPYKTRYSGNYTFADDTAGLKPKAIQKILKARDEAYYGSRMHFVRSLWAGHLDDDGFKVYFPQKKIGNVADYHIDRKYRAGQQQLVTIKTDKIYKDQKFIAFPDEVAIEYLRKKNDQERSFLKRSDDWEGAIIDPDGYYGSGIEWKGFMSFSRVNALLPIEFVPSSVVKQ